MLIIKSFVATDTGLLFAISVDVAIPIPALKSIPSGKDTLAPDNAGITIEKYLALPANGVVAKL